MGIGTRVEAGVAGSPCAPARGSAPHIGVFLKKKVLWVVCIAMVALLPGQVRAQAATMESLQTQIRELQRQLDTLKEQVRQSQAARGERTAPDCCREAQDGRAAEAARSSIPTPTSSSPSAASSRRQGYTAIASPAPMSTRDGTSAPGASPCRIPPTTTRTRSAAPHASRAFLSSPRDRRIMPPLRPISRSTSSGAARAPPATPRKATATTPASVISMRPMTRRAAGTSSRVSPGASSPWTRRA